MRSQDLKSPSAATMGIRVALLTGGDDRSYALGLTAALVAQGVTVDFIGSDRVDGPELHNSPLVNFLNLRGDQSENASLPRKVMRLLAYYLRLLKYAAVAKPRVFHILWNNKFEWFDRTLLLAYYRLLGRIIVLTAHNVNAAKRDGCDTAFNRFTLGIQYRLASHLFVHTHKMKDELLADFRVPEHRVSVIPFGLNDTTPLTALTAAEARGQLGLKPEHKVALFFGQIAPYKGLEYLVAALPELTRRDPAFRLVIAGKVKRGCEDYWAGIQRDLSQDGVRTHLVSRIEHIPNEQVEVYFKAVDVLVIPYVHIFQSGVPFLAYSFGLPVIATDVGSLKEDIIEGKTGMICRPRDPSHLAGVTTSFFSSELYQRRAAARAEIQEFAKEKHSWTKVGAITENVYRNLLVGS
jgi:glycosyltransferase involved in cell wall biosynthesis